MAKRWKNKRAFANRMESSPKAKRERVEHEAIYQIEKNLATPKYNNKPILDTTGLYVKHLEEIYIASQECEAFSDALLLLKIWLKQRQFDQASGIFSGFITSMLLVYLLQQKKVTPKMSSYQIPRVTWQFLASSDWSKDGIAMTSLSNRVIISQLWKDFQKISQPFKFKFAESGNTLWNLVVMLHI